MSQGTQGDAGYGNGASRPGGTGGPTPPGPQPGTHAPWQQPQPPGPHGGPNGQHAPGAPGVPDPTWAPGVQGAPGGHGAPGQAGGPWQGPGPGSGAADLRAQLARLGLVNPLGGLVVTVIAYVAASIVAVIVAVSAFIALRLSSNDDAVPGITPPADATSTGDGGAGAFELLRGIVGIPAQLVASGTFGAYRIEFQVGFLASGGGSSRALPLAITATILLVGWFGGRFLHRRQPGAKLLGMALTALVSGLLMAIITTALARILAFDVRTDEISLSMHAAGFASFFGAWFLLGGALLLGQLSVAERPAWWSSVSEVASGARLVLLHGVTYSVFAVVLLSVAVVARGLLQDRAEEGFAMVLLLPAAIGQAIAYAVGLTVLGSAKVEVSGAVTSSDQGRFEERWLWILSSGGPLPWYLALFMLLVGLLLLVAAAAQWGNGRRIAPRSILATAISWAVLPVLYVGAGIVLLILGGARFDLGLSGIGSVHAGVHLGFWLPVLTGIVGVMVEVLSRVLGPLSEKASPRGPLAWFRRREEAIEGGIAPVLIPGSVLAGATAAGATAPGGPAGVPVAPGGSWSPSAQGHAEQPWTPSAPGHAQQPWTPSAASVPGAPGQPWTPGAPSAPGRAWSAGEPTAPGRTWSSGDPAAPERPWGPEGAGNPGQPSSDGGPATPSSPWPSGQVPVPQGGSLSPWQRPVTPADAPPAGGPQGEDRWRPVDPPVPGPDGHDGPGSAPDRRG